jgi:PTH2 family peptidyl-tRNA hydrolase
MSEIITQKKTLTEEQKKWLFGSFAKICVYVETKEELDEIYYKALEAKLTVRMVTDAGKTEFHDIPTQTCLAIGPNYASEIDEITGNLPLL